MKKNRVTSVFQVVCFIVNIPIAIINLMLYLFTKDRGSDEIVSMFLYSSIICILVILLSIIINITFSCFGKRRVVINSGSITYMNKEYKINEEARIIYSKISLQNIIGYGCPGDLLLIIDNKPIKLGWYFRFEINKMKKYIPIKFEAQNKL